MDAVSEAEGEYINLPLGPSGGFAVTLADGSIAVAGAGRGNGDDDVVPIGDLVGWRSLFFSDHAAYEDLTENALAELPGYPWIFALGGYDPRTNMAQYAYTGLAIDRDAQRVLAMRISRCGNKNCSKPAPALAFDPATGDKDRVRRDLVLFDANSGSELAVYSVSNGSCGVPNDRILSSNIDANGVYLVQDCSLGRDIARFDIGSNAFSPALGSTLDAREARRLWAERRKRHGIDPDFRVSEDDRLVFIFGHNEGPTFSIYERRTARHISDFFYFRDGAWVLLTPQGFYSAGNRGDERLEILRGLERHTIDQFRESLFRPDLVRELLLGDPEGLVAKASQTLSLTHILESGSPPDATTSAVLDGAQARVEAFITETGGGIGRQEWRVNGVTQISIDDGRQESSATLKLAAGPNRIDFIAYNSMGTIHSRAEPITLNVSDDDLPEPRLFVLTVGVDDYQLNDLKLRFAVTDANAVAHAFAEAGKGTYGEVVVSQLTDGRATRAGIAAEFRRLAGEIGPNDVFVFFFAGHGKTLDGRYYVIPQDFNGTTLGDLRTKAIGQATWQDWFVSIPAQRSLILFDSCESGSLAESVSSRELRFRAANDALGNSTGRALLTASSGSGVALEGYEKHGIFTFAILRALRQADADKNGQIAVEELADDIRAEVPKISLEAFGERQSPEFRPAESDFVLFPPLQ